MLWGAHQGELEVRKPRPGKPGYALRGRFPYGSPAVLSDGGRTGRPKKEIVAPGAFNYRLALDPGPKENDIHLLVGHSYDRPLASRNAGTLSFTDTPEALIFDAVITEDMQRVSYVQDVIAAIGAGLILGISPGFRIPPERAVPADQAEEITEEEDKPEEGMHRAIIRTVKQALLYEFSLVTRPAYPEAQVEERNWQMHQPVSAPSHLKRWRL